MEKIKLAEEWARQQHGDALYNGLPYFEGHLLPVKNKLAQYGFDTSLWIILALLHDTLEDGFSDLVPLERKALIALHFGAEIADLIWAVSGFGEKRRHRNADIYAKLENNARAAILKLADRIINAQGRLREMYRKEQPEFEKVIRHQVPPEMWAELEAIFAEEPVSA